MSSDCGHGLETVRTETSVVHTGISEVTGNILKILLTYKTRLPIVPE